MEVLSGRVSSGIYAKFLALRDSFFLSIRQGFSLKTCVPRGFQLLGLIGPDRL